MNTIKHWAEQLKKGELVNAFIRHSIDGSKNRKEVLVKVLINCKEFGCDSIIAKDFEDITYRVPYNELSKPINN